MIRRFLILCAVALTVAAKPQCGTDSAVPECTTTKLKVGPGQCIELEACDGDDWDAMLRPELEDAPDGVWLRVERRDTWTSLFVCASHDVQYVLDRRMRLVYSTAGGEVHAAAIDLRTGDPMELTVTATPSTITYGDTVLLQMTVTGGAPPFRYTWTTSQPVDDREAAVTFSRPKESGRYFAAVFDRVGYAVRGHVDVNVHPRLVASASLDTITVGESSELRVVKTGGSQAMSVSWYPSDTLDYPAEWRPVATPLETTVYTARVRTLDNLDTEASVRVTVLPPP